MNDLPTIEYLKGVLELCALFHVEQLHVPGKLTLRLREEDGPRLTSSAPVERAKMGEIHGMPTDDELLFASAPGGAPSIAAEPPQ